MDNNENHKTENEVVPLENPDTEEKAELFSEGDSFTERFVKRLLIVAVEAGASDIFFEPQEEDLRVRLRIDGLLCEAESCSVKYSSSIISYIKVISSLDIAEHRFPQDGRFRVHINSKPIDFRVSIVATNLGEKVVLRVLDKGNIKLDLDTLTFDIESMDILKRNLKKPYGMIIVCGPTGSGKTTTLYSSLKYIDSVDINVVTVEDPVEYQMPGVNQVAVNEQIGLTFAAVLRSILRQDPDVILIGEIRDVDTADIAIKASLTGHLVLSTIHATTATGAIVRFINMGIEPFLMASSCLATAAQALLRKLCPDCKVEIDAPDNIEEIFNMSNVPFRKGLKYYKPGGCRFCANIGYKGRIGLIEILEVDSDIKELLNRGASDLEIRERAIANGMKTLRDKALLQIIQGNTTMKEVFRVTL